MRSRVRLLEGAAAPGAWNMAVDEALMASARRGLVTLRLYRWDPPCLSLGRHERARGRYDAEEAARRGIDIVRRPTGGRAVYHDDELTYAVAAPTGMWGGLRESYARINHALARGLRALGVPAETAGGAGAPGSPPAASRASSPSAAPRVSSAAAPPAAPVAPGRPRLGAGPCFAAPAPGEVTAAGRKLVGSAQWREGGALLQHGSLLLTDGQAVVRALRRPHARAAGRAPARPNGSGALRGRPAPGAGAIGLAELLGRRPARTELREALVVGFGEELALTVEPGGLSSEEREAARRREARYRDDAWTWRR